MTTALIWIIKKYQQQAMLYKTAALAACLLAAPAYAFSPKPFLLHFQATIKGLHATLDQSLSQDESGTYQLYQVTQAAFVKIEETSIFQIKNQTLQPLHYRYQRRVFGVNTQRNSDFSQDGKQASFTENNKHNVTIATPDDTTDSLNFIIAIQQWLEGKPALNAQTQIDVLEKKSVHQQVYRLVEQHDWLETPLGWFDTTVVQRIRDDDQRYTKMWLANQWDFLPIKIEHRDGDDQHSLFLSSGQLDDKPIKGLEKPANKKPESTP